MPVNTVPVDVIEAISRTLPLRDRVALTSCCRGLWARPDVLASSGLWGDLAFTSQHLNPSQRTFPSLAAWLHRRRAGCRRLRLSFGSAGAGALSLLSGLECDDGGLLTLELSSHQPVHNSEEALGALRDLTRLTRLEARGGFLGTSLPSHISCLRQLAVLDVSRNTQLGQLGALHVLESLSASLTSLDLGSCGLRRLPASITALRRLAALDLNTNSLGGDGQEGSAPLAALSYLVALTSLCLRWCGLATLPPTLSRLRKLAVLDASRNNGLGAGGDSTLEPLQHLTSLAALDISYCGLTSVPPQLGHLPALAVCRMSGNLRLGEGPGGEGGWCALKQLRALTRLDLTRCNVQQRHFDMLATMSRCGVCVTF
ncbi:hypothetical protein N2152v2_009501 [Parachlorella kessleri]